MAGDGGADDPGSPDRGTSPGNARATLVPGSGLVELGRQVALVVGAILIYFGVRGLTEGSEALAIENGRSLLRFERELGIAIEHGLQGAIKGSWLLTTLANWVYIWLHWPVIAGTLLWLHRHRRLDYLFLRNAMFASGAIGLVIFVLVPVAPPRLLGAGFVDTVTDLSTSYRVLQPPGLVNRYAAMPSLHVGWNLLVGIVLWRLSTHRVLRVMAAAGPVLMTVAVMATANHYLVDALAGSAVALVGLVIAQRITLPLARRGHRPRRADEGEIVHDHPVHPPPPQSGNGRQVGDRPRPHRTAPPQPAQHPLGEEPVVHDGAVDGDPGRQPQQQRQLDAVAGRSQRAHVRPAGEAAEQPPRLR